MTTSEVWTAADGRVLPGPDGAAAVEVIEYDAAGEELERTYATLDRATGRPAVPDPDEDAADGEDWIKTGSWDLWEHDAQGRLVPLATLTGLLRALDVADDAPVQGRREALANFLTLPAWSAAPAALREQVVAFLEQTRPSA